MHSLALWGLFTHTTSEIPTLSYTRSVKKVPLSGGGGGSLPVLAIRGSTPPPVCSLDKSLLDKAFSLYAWLILWMVIFLVDISQLFLEPKWAIDLEAMRVRGIIVSVKSN